jgi:leucyl-tRNA synthetase
MEMFGQEFENIEPAEQDVDEVPTAESSNPSAPRVNKGKKGKLAAKSTATHISSNLLSLSVFSSEVKKFADPYHWLTYFPPIAIISMNLLSVPGRSTIVVVNPEPGCKVWFVHIKENFRPILDV